MNTIDQLGDAETFGRIIDGTLTSFVNEEQIDVVANYAFAYTSLELFDCPMEKLGDYMFTRCKQLQSVELHGMCKSISYEAFNGCSALESIDLTNVESMRPKAFINCTGLESIYIPKIKQLGNKEFSGCKNLKNVNLPYLEQLFITAGENTTFGYCSSLININIPNVTKIGKETFNGCSALESIDLPAVENMNDRYIFYNCDSLTTVIIRTTTLVPIIDVYTFANTRSDLLFYVPDSLVNSYKEATNWSAYADRIKPLSELPEEEET